VDETVGFKLAAAVSGLVELDVSDAVQLSAGCLLQLLAAAGNLKRLGASGCTTLAAEGAGQALEGRSCWLNMAEMVDPEP
jgi:hypothetical protein